MRNYIPEIIPYATMAAAERYGEPRADRNGGRPRVFVREVPGGWVAVAWHGTVSRPEWAGVYGAKGTSTTLDSADATAWSSGQ